MKVKVFHIRLTKEHLQIDQENINDFLSSVSVQKTVSELVTGQPNFWSILVFYNDLKIQKEESRTNKIAVTELENQTEYETLKTLKKWRQNKAEHLNIPNFMVCHNSELMTIAKLKPQTLDDFLKIKGFGRRKIAKFGSDILAVLNSI